MDDQFLSVNPWAWKRFEKKKGQKDAAAKARQSKAMALNLEDALKESLWCAMHLEFALTPSVPRVPSATTTGATRERFLRQPVVGRPPRIVLLALALGPSGPSMACSLSRTAVAQGWDMYLAVGRYTGLIGKYSRTLEAIELMHLNDNDKVVFVDGSDVLAQLGPEAVIKTLAEGQAFAADLIFSAEDNCFPLGGWPHSLGLDRGRYVCDHRFPVANESTTLNKVGTHWVNTGGWVATARAAKLALEQMDALVTAHHESKCYKGGTDQLLGNAMFLRHRDRNYATKDAKVPRRDTVGLDADSKIFASSPQHSTLLSLTNTKNPSYPGVSKAFCRTPEMCPAFLHFNGGMTDMGMESSLLGSWESPCARGRVTILDIDRRAVQVNATIPGCTSDLPECTTA